VLAQTQNLRHPFHAFHNFDQVLPEVLQAEVRLAAFTIGVRLRLADRDTATVRVVPRGGVLFELEVLLKIQLLRLAGAALADRLMLPEVVAVVVAEAPGAVLALPGQGSSAAAKASALLALLSSSVFPDDHVRPLPTSPITVRGTEDISPDGGRGDWPGR
jgi:hypothetical protein